MTKSWPQLLFCCKTDSVTDFSCYTREAMTKSRLASVHLSSMPPSWFKLKGVVSLHSKSKLKCFVCSIRKARHHNSHVDVIMKTGCIERTSSSSSQRGLISLNLRTCNFWSGHRFLLGRSIMQNLCFSDPRSRSKLTSLTTSFTVLSFDPKCNLKTVKTHARYADRSFIGRYH